MKKMIGTIALLLAAICVFSQTENPVSWSFTARKINDLTYELHLTATMEDGWHIYSQTTPDGGPVPTEINFSKNPLFVLDGKVKEVGKMEQRAEPLFGVDVKQFSDKVDFVQVVKLKAKARTNASGSVKFMSCNDQMCLPPRTISFNISLK